MTRKSVSRIVPFDPIADAHRVLGTSPDDDYETIDDAFLALVKEHHPDNSDDPHACNRFREINLAYARLAADAIAEAACWREFDADAPAGSSIGVTKFEDMLSGAKDHAISEEEEGGEGEAKPARAHDAPSPQEMNRSSTRGSTGRASIRRQSLRASTRLSARSSGIWADGRKMDVVWTKLEAQLEKQLGTFHLEPDEITFCPLRVRNVSGSSTLIRDDEGVYHQTTSWEQRYSTIPCCCLGEAIAIGTSAASFTLETAAAPRTVTVAHTWNGIEEEPDFDSLRADEDPQSLRPEEGWLPGASSRDSGPPEGGWLTGLSARQSEGEEKPEEWRAPGWSMGAKPPEEPAPRRSIRDSVSFTSATAMRQPLVLVTRDTVTPMSMKELVKQKRISDLLQGAHITAAPFYFFERERGCRGKMNKDGTRLTVRHERGEFNCGKCIWCPKPVKQVYVREAARRDT